LTWAVLVVIGQYPLRQRRFLNDVADRLLLRRNGERYEFHHLLIRDYFREQPGVGKLRSTEKLASGDGLGR
jgi:hypothetical protein